MEEKKRRKMKNKLKVNKLFLNSFYLLFLANKLKKN